MLASKSDLLAASLAHLIGTDPFSFDGPCTETFVFGVIPSEMTVFDQTSSRVTTVKVNHFVLCCCELAFVAIHFLNRTWHILANKKVYRTVSTVSVDNFRGERMSQCLGSKNLLFVGEQQLFA